MSGGGVRLGDSAERREDVCEIKLDVGVLAEQVGLRGKGCRRAREVLSLAVTAAVGQYPCQNSLAESLGDEVLTGRSLPACRDQANGFVIPARTLRRDGSGQFRRCGGQVTPLAHPVQEAVFEAKMLLGGRWIACKHRDEGCGLSGRRRYPCAEAVQEAIREAERCLRRREVVLHRVQACEVVK